MRPHEGSQRAVLAVMMPIYNEARTLRRILARVLAQPEVGEVIAVDDGSTDESWAILEEAARADRRVRPFRQPENMGKGAALKRAIEHLTMPFALVQDADLEYDPADYSILLDPLLTGRADVCYGAREFAGHTAYSFWFVLGGRAITLACNLLYNSYVTDILTGYKVLRSDLWKRLNLKRDGFDIDPEITGQVLRLGYRIHEVPINYFARSREEGKKVGVQDGLHALITLLEIRVRSPKALFARKADPAYHRERQHELAEQHPFMSDEPAPERVVNGTAPRLRRVR